MIQQPHDVIGKEMAVGNYKISVNLVFPKNKFMGYFCTFFCAKEVKFLASKGHTRLREVAVLIRQTTMIWIKFVNEL